MTVCSGFDRKLVLWGNWCHTGNKNPALEFHDLLASAGFVEIEIIVRNAWFTEFNRQLAEHMSGPGYDALVAAVGKDTAERLIATARRREIISAQGQLRPGHLRGHKPA